MCTLDRDLTWSNWGLFFLLSVLDLDFGLVTHCMETVTWDLDLDSKFEAHFGLCV